MRTLKVYRHGLTMGTPPQKNDHTRATRGVVQGWSESATRRNTAFLRSADERLLPTTNTGEPLRAWAFTLTLKRCPPTPDDWHRIRKAFFKRIDRLGLYRSHWVTEWQKRGVPHLHGAFWFPESVRPSSVIDHWLDLTADFGALRFGQHVTPVHDSIGWFKYLSKHASRGVKHYQRNPENIPPEWKMKTGRVWGYTGDWPVISPIAIRLDDSGFFKLRRLFRGWRKSDARLSGLGYRIRQARGMLSSPDRALCSVRGVSEWIPEDFQFVCLHWLKSEGCSVES